MAPSARRLRPQAVGERTVRLSEIFRAVARFSPSAPSGHRSPSGASATSPVSGESVSQREAFRHAGLPSRGATIAAAPKGSPQRGAPAQRVRGGRDAPTPPHITPHKNHKTQNRGCIRHSSIFLFIFCAAHSDRIGCNRATNLRKLIVQNAQKRQKMCKTAGIKKKCTAFNTKNVVANLLNSTLRPFTQ